LADKNRRLALELAAAPPVPCVRRRTDFSSAQALHYAMGSAHSRPAKRSRYAAAASVPHANQLLCGLSGVARRRLIARCKPVELAFGEILYEQGERIRDVYFPTGGFISLISALDERPRLEVGLVGAEGMLGASLLLGVHIAPVRALVQGAGSALRMDAAQFAREVRSSPRLLQRLNCYQYVLMCQLSQLAACTHFHVVEARLARWLLMTRDRAHSDAFYITQEFMAYMLGVRRVGITQAASRLQRRKLIRYRRGKLTILDGPGLEAAACGCYVVAKDLYNRVMN
jgi:CRP-like cAMP-binding protein